MEAKKSKLEREKERRKRRKELQKQKKSFWKKRVIYRKLDPNNLRSKNQAQSIVFTSKDIIRDSTTSEQLDRSNEHDKPLFPAFPKKRAVPAVLLNPSVDCSE